MSLELKPIMTGADELLRTLAEVPDRVQNRVIRFAHRKVGQAVERQASRNTPRRNPPRGEHLADRFVSKQINYRNGISVMIVGGEAGPHNRINHLVEEGTAARFTNHRSLQVKEQIGTRIRNKRIKTANGIRTVKVTQDLFRRRSVGSFWTGVGRPMPRGTMPAFHQLRRAVESVAIEGILETELTAGLQRIADRNAE